MQAAPQVEFLPKDDLNVKLVGNVFPSASYENPEPLEKYDLVSHGRTIILLLYERVTETWHIANVFAFVVRTAHTIGLQPPPITDGIAVNTLYATYEVWHKTVELTTIPGVPNRFGTSR